MNKILTLLFTLFTACSLWAQKPADLNKAVVNVITYDSDGNILKSAYGFFLGSNGEIVAPYQAFKGAVRADVINWQGQSSQVLRIIGASSDYDIIRCTTNTPTKKLVGLETSTTHAAKDQQLQQAFYTTEKKSMPTSSTITSADLYKDHYYYETTTPNEDKFFGCPILDAEGHAVALIQKNVQKDATTACAIDINFATELKTSALSAFNTDLNDVKIAKQIPLDDEEGAFSYIYMKLQSPTDSTLVMTACEDYIAAYPEDAKIFSSRAMYFTSHGNFSAAEADLQHAIAMGGENVSDVWNTRSSLIYNKVLYGGYSAENDPFPAWTLDEALVSIQKAYELSPRPLYQLQLGQVQFSLQQYQKAYEAFQMVNASELANAQTFYFAANALERAEGEDAQVIALLDSCVAHLATPYTTEAAPYLLARAQHLDNAGQHRRASADFNEYEKIIGPKNLNSYFYYLRMQAEIGSRMYQQALDDAATAITFAQTNDEKVDYLFEQACLQLQVNLLDESIASCEQILALAPEHAEAYKIAAVACGEKKNKEKAQQYFKKAIELGAENAETLAKKYK